MANSDLFLGLISYSFIIPIFPKVPKTMKSFFTPNSCTSLVIWDSISLGSTIGLPKFPNFLRGLTSIPSYYLSVITGILLGDASIRRSASNHNARLGFSQSITNHFEYFWHVFTILAHYCSFLPYLDKTTLKNGKTYFKLSFLLEHTLAFLCFLICGLLMVLRLFLLTSLIF
jgi:LAGLIDADG DNA endonuclease family